MNELIDTFPVALQQPWVVYLSLAYLVFVWFVIEWRKRK